MLADSTSNILNNRTVPWLDIGDLPIAYSFQRSASFQKFLTPEQNPPYQFYYNYSEWLDGYLCNLDQLFESLDAMNRKVNRQMLNETIERSSQVVMSTRGTIAKTNRIQSYAFTFGTIILLVIACVLGITLNSWLWVLLILVAYGLAAGAFIVVRKTKQSQVLQLAHLQLSLFLRAENNRYYMRNGLELRPGFLAKWIEVNILKENDPTSIIQNIARRQLNQSLANEKLKAQVLVSKLSSRGLPPKYLEPSDLQDVHLSGTDLEAYVDQSHTVHQLNSANMSAINIVDKNEELKVCIKGVDDVMNNISVVD